jgi:hypothetical protein
MRCRTPDRPIAAAWLAAAAAVLLAVAPVTTTRAAAGDKQPAAAGTPQKAAANAKSSPPATPVAIPAEVRARVVAKLPGAQASDVAVSPISGLYEVTMGGLIAYVSADGKYLLSGNVYDLDSQENLTAARRNTARAKALAAASESKAGLVRHGPP